ncbi:putative reverse transcriptase domain-containing protein [Tanacetum coccineum]
MVDIPDDVDLVDYDGDDEENPKEDLKEEPELNNGLMVRIGVVPKPPSDDEGTERPRKKSKKSSFDRTEGPSKPHGPPRESSSARDSSYVGGLAPWALRRDLETSRLRARLTEAELSTNQAEIALLKSKNKIGKKERELLDHDLGDVERTLGNVLEMLKVLESGENATLKKRLTETETKLAWARMERDIAEGRLHESRVWNKRFYMEMVRIGAVPKPPSDDEGTERPRKKSKKSSFDGAKGPSEPRGPPSDSKDKEPIRVRALVVTVHNNLPEQIRNAQVEACKKGNIRAEGFFFLAKESHLKLNLMARSARVDYFGPRRCERTIQTLEDMLRACVIDFGSGWDKNLPLAEFSYNNSYHASIKAAPFEALYGRKCRSPVCWSKVGDAQLTGPEMIRETTEMNVQIKNRLLAARSRQKSYADVRRKTLEFEILSRIGLVAYKLELPRELQGIHNTFHVSNLKKCLSDEDLIIPFDKVRIDEKLHFIEEPIEIMDREVEQLKQSRIPIVKI